MATEDTIPQNPAKQIARTLFQFYRSASPILVPVALFIGGTLRPYAEQTILRSLFSEKAGLFLSFDRPAVRLGEDVGIRTWIMPNGRLPLTGGLLRLEFDHEAFATQGSAVFGFAGGDKPVMVPEAEAFRVMSKRTGTFPITAALTTQRGEYRVTSHLTVLPLGSSGAPTIQNFSGKWQIRLGAITGTMAMIQDGTSVAGSYHLDNDTAGSFSGIKDGSSFKVDLFRRAPRRKWYVDATWKKNLDWIEISGSARPLRLEGDVFIGEGPAVPFYAAVHSF